MQSVFDVGVPGPFDRNLIGGRNAAPSVARPFLAGDLAPAVVADFAGASGREGYAKPLPVPGPELVTNGGFDVDSAWSKGLWTISGGLASLADNQSGLSQPFTFKPGATYRVTWKIADMAAGSVYIGFLGGSSVFAPSVTSDGQYTYEMTAKDGNVTLYIGTTANTTVSIDNISVREITGYRAVRTTFTDLLTHSRSGNATMVDRDGLLKWAPHNFLMWSEDFTNAAWTDGSISGGSRSSGALSVSSSEGYAYAQQAISVATGVAHTIEVDVTCDATVSAVPLRAGLGASNDANLVDFSAGETKRVSFSVTPTSGTLTIGLDARNSVVPGGSDETGYTVTLNKASAYRSDLGGMVDNPDRGDSYVPTTSAARFLPRRNHCTYDLAAGEITGPNLIGNGQFAQGFGGWGAYRNATLSVSSGALRVTSDAATTGASASRSFATVPGKAYALRFEKVAVSVGGRARVAIGHHGDLGNAAATDLADAYYDGADGPYEVRFFAEQATTWVILANQNASTSYVEFDNVSCFEVLPGVIQGCLHESEARTNLLTYSWDFANAAWTSANTVELAGQADSPAGALSATKLAATAVNGDHYCNLDTSATAGVTYTLSVLAKAAEYDRVCLRFGGALAFNSVKGAFFDLSTGTFDGFNGDGVGVTYHIEPWGDGWFLVGITATADNTATLLNRISPADATGTTFLGDGTSGIYIDEAQLEVGRTPSSRIPTNGATATRPADVLTIPAAKLPFHPDGVWVAMAGKVTYPDRNDVDTVRFYHWVKYPENHYVFTRLQTNGTNTGQIVPIQYDGVSLDLVNSTGNLYSPGINVPFSLAARHGPTYINGAVDGVALTADNTPTSLPNLSAADLLLGNTFMGVIEHLAVGAGDPGDAGIAEVSA